MQLIKTVTSGKKMYIFIICTFTYMIIFLIWLFGFNPWVQHNLEQNSFKDLLTKPNNDIREMIYILQWTKSYTEPFKFMGKGQQAFVGGNCSAQNCFVTSDKRYLSDTTKFDAVLFHGPELYLENLGLPEQRSAHQKFVFVSMESSHYYPICHNKYNGYFNWTWTYKLNSDVYFGYMIIKNKQGDVIGPREVMHWTNVDEMQPVDNDLKAKLSTKKIAAAWFVSNCNTPSGRENVAKQLQQELAKYNMTLDIYGQCGTMSCPSDSMEDCLRIVERDYYFYLSFENSFSEDYVTEKLLHALQHNAVPIVFGGANYSRFMPNGIYLDARKHSAKELAKQMFDLIEDKDKYYHFFKWHNHYTYHNVVETPETNYYCRFCDKLNNEDVMKEWKVYDDMMGWWNPPQNFYDNKIGFLLLLLFLIFFIIIIFLATYKHVF